MEVGAEGCRALGAGLGAFDRAERQRVEVYFVLGMGVLAGVTERAVLDSNRGHVRGATAWNWQVRQFASLVKDGSS